MKLEDYLVTQRNQALDALATVSAQRDHAAAVVEAAFAALARCLTDGVDAVEVEKVPGFAQWRDAR
jgi:hypothetical protein